MRNLSGDQFAKQRSIDLRILALDLGERRIGVALSDPLGLIASPLTTIPRSDQAADIKAILELAQEHQAQEIVIGLPLSLRGEVGRQARSVRQFSRALAESSSIPIKTWDERLSTQEADRLLRQAGVIGSRDKGRRDAAAAAVILQAYLDSLKDKVLP